MRPTSKYLVVVLAAIAAAPLVQATGQDKIVFHSERVGPGNNDIFVMNADGSGLTNLTNDAVDDISPAFNADGSKIVYRSSGPSSPDIFVMNADGTGKTNLTNDYQIIDSNPAFSWDGSKIAFQAWEGFSEQIHVMNADGSGRTNLSNNLFGDASPAFRPDGSKIVFESGRDGNSEIYIMNADGTGVTRLTFSAGRDQRPVFSPDGSKIAFDSNRSAGFQIYVMNPDGSGLTNLTNHTGTNWSAAFSPDGSKIAFASGRDGNSEIYIMNADGSGQTRLTNNAANDAQPSIGMAQTTTVSPDSFSLFRGILTGGGLSDLLASDDSWMRVRPGITLNQAERQVQLIVVGTSPTETPSELRIRVEAHAEINNIGQWIELWNYDTSSWEEVDFMIATLADSIVEVSITVDPGRFIEAGTRQMKAKISYKEAGIVLSYPWLISFDQTVWIIVY
ncbi:MAG: PD40 domain-containing protein [Armatimonadetes bacterium]|nr:PD40 domain-containing protein [Armatimonadota bacterium]